MLGVDNWGRSRHQGKQLIQFLDRVTQIVFHPKISGAWSTGPLNFYTGVPNYCVPLLWNWLHVTVIEHNICGYLVWNWLHITFIEPNICGSLVWKWLHITVIESNICGSIVSNRLHVTVRLPNIWGPLV